MFWFLFFLIIWLLLWWEWSLPSVLGSLILAYSLFRFSRPFLKQDLRLRLFGWSRFWLRVFFDIIIANFTVARQVLDPFKKLNPTIIEIPVDLETDIGLTLFQLVINIVPGTLTVRTDRDHRIVVVHVLSSETPEEILHTLKKRYEQPLLKLLAP